MLRYAYFLLDGGRPLEIIVMQTYVFHALVALTYASNARLSSSEYSIRGASNATRSNRRSASWRERGE